MDPVQKFEVEKFDGKGDFGMWKFKILMQLELQGFGKLIEEITGEPSKDEEDETDQKSKIVLTKKQKKERDVRARNLICSSLTDMVLQKVMKHTTAAGVWEALEKDYQTKVLPNQIYLKQKFTGFKMDEHKSIEQNVDAFLKLVDDLASLGIEVSKEDQAIQILTGLPKLYAALAHTLKYGRKKNEVLELEEVITLAYAKEMELREEGLLSKVKLDAEGLYVSKGKTEKKSDGKKKGKWKGKGKEKTNDGKKGQSKVRECWICGKAGHFKRDCPERKDTKSSNSANMAQE